MNKMTAFCLALHTHWLFSVWQWHGPSYYTHSRADNHALSGPLFKQVREVNADIVQDVTCVEINNSYSTTPADAATISVQPLRFENRPSKLIWSLVWSNRSCKRTKSHLELYGSHYRWSKQLRQNYGCLTPISFLKPRLCDRWSHPFLLWVVNWEGRGHGALPVRQLLWPLCSKYLSRGEPPL